MIEQQKSIDLPRGRLMLTYALNTSLDYQLDDLIDFAQRINPKRAFLFVSKVLGRHIPVAPSQMRQAFSDLASLIPDRLPEPIVVVGMSETAVGLSAGVHQVLQTRYPQAVLLNSTRHAQTDATLLTTFTEDHSHASKHLVYASDDSAVQARLLASKTLIMVDDEASTGNTCLHVVDALQQAGLSQLKQVHLATLVDWSLGQISMGSDLASQMGNVEFYRHHLLAGKWQWTDAANAAKQLPVNMPKVDTTEAGSVPLVATGNWGRLPTMNSTTGFTNYRDCFLQAYQRQFGTAFNPNDSINNDTTSNTKRLLILGSNEFVWLPFLLAEWLEAELSQHQVAFCATTRSPITLGKAIKTKLSFQDNYGLGMTNFVYNVTPKDWDLIVLCVETAAGSVDELWQGLDNVLVVSP